MKEVVTEGGPVEGLLFEGVALQPRHKSAEIANVLIARFRRTRETAVEAFLTKQSIPMK
jgi:hypothetical protein